MIEKLKALGLELPQISKPGGNYVSVNIRGNIGYVAIQFPIINGVYHYRGRLGEQLETIDGAHAMQMCALNVLAQIEAKVGWDRVEGLNQIDAYYRSTAEWDEAAIIVNGASDLFVEVLGEKGRHSRAIFGVEQLPGGLSVGLKSSFTLI